MSAGVVVIGRHAAAGLALGVLWGVAARVWMRLISTAPEFSWGGTLSIIAGAGVTGVCLGVVSGANRAGRSRWWRLAGLPVLLLFASPGVVFLPAAVLSGWSLAGRGRRWLRVTVGSLGLLSSPWMAYTFVDDGSSVIVPGATRVVVGAALLGLGVALGTRVVFRGAGSRPAVVVDTSGNGRQAVPRAAHQLSRARLDDRRS